MSNDATTATSGKESRHKPAPNLDQMTVQELTALIEAAETKRREKQGEAKATLLAKWQAEAAEAGLTFEAVLPASSASAEPNRKPRKDAGTLLPAKYKGPNGGEWSGRGRLPKWLLTMEAEGRNREEFRV